MPHLFSDNDGVLADFEAGFKQVFGREFNDVPVGVAWKMIYRDPDFYFKLPMMPGAEKYWETILPLNPTILTGCPTSGYDAAADAKRRWIAKYLGAAVPVITCYSRNKPDHMLAAGDVLIDDHEKNTSKWIAAGGHGILLVDHDQALAELAEYLQK